MCLAVLSVGLYPSWCSFFLVSPLRRSHPENSLVPLFVSLCQSLCHSLSSLLSTLLDADDQVCQTHAVTQIHVFLTLNTKTPRPYHLIVPPLLSLNLFSYCSQTTYSFFLLHLKKHL